MSLYEAYVKRNEDCAFRIIDEQALVVRLSDDGSSVFTLNKTGARIWELADGSRTLAQICEELQRSFDAPGGDELLGDVRAFINELRDRGMVRAEDPLREER
ncbi:MAG: PqqD family protein [Actinobacteria bacterium]|nr:MAG: PqqD family protein [Actinomycetota bacterium]